MYITDTILNLEKHNIYTKGKRTLTTSKVAAIILVNEYILANESGNTWSLSIKDLVKVTNCDTKVSLFKALDYLCAIGKFESYPNPENRGEAVYSPIIIDDKWDIPTFIDLAWIDRPWMSGQLILKSPRSEAPVPNSLVKGDATESYALIAYESSAFRTVSDASIIVEEHLDPTNPKLKGAWLEINGVSVVPEKLDLALIEEFWDIVDESYLLSRGMVNDTVKPIKWRQVSDSYWNKSIPLGTRDAYLKKMMINSSKASMNKTKRTLDVIGIDKIQSVEYIDNSSTYLDTTTPTYVPEQEKDISNDDFMEIMLTISKLDAPRDLINTIMKGTAYYLLSKNG